MESVQRSHANGLAASCDLIFRFMNVHVDGKIEFIGQSPNSKKWGIGDRVWRMRGEGEPNA